LLANQNLITEVAAFYGMELIGTPATYMTFANQWKFRSGIMNKSVGNSISRSSYDIDWNPMLEFDVPIAASSLKYNLYFETGNLLVSKIPFNLRIKGNFKIYESANNGKSAGLYFKIYNSNGVLLETKIINTTVQNNYIDFDILFNTNTDGTYNIKYGIKVASPHSNNYVGVWMNYGAEAISNFTALEQAATLEGEVYTDYPTFEEPGYYPCWQNLPKVTAKKLIETIALAAGKMIEYSSNKITFVDFESVFSPDNAFDASEYLQEWSSKEFKVLENRTNQVVYASGKQIVYFDVKDETLNTEPYTVADLGCIRIEDDTDTDRNTDDIVLSELTDTHFYVITKFPILYAPLVSPVVFEAKFKYFKENRKPLLVRQLNGIFIAMESVITTKDSITLRLLKIK
jgi:hypothetical protein